MADEQNATERNSSYLFESLEAEQQEAVLYAFSGWPYPRIAKEIKRPYATVRRWFMTGGICKPAYDELIKQQAKENRKQLKKIADKIQEALPDALETLHKSAKGGNWKAAESLLHIGGHAPLTKIQATIDNTDKEHVMAILKELRSDGNTTAVRQDKTTS